MDKEMLPLVMNACASSPSFQICTTNAQRIACQTLCEITSDFSGLPLTNFKLKNRHWWNTGQKYHRINYIIKVALGPADICFELWHNGQKLNNDNPIKVEWQAAQAPPEPPVNKGFYQQWQPDPSVAMVNGQAHYPYRN
jgi:hypothetical protein